MDIPSSWWSSAHKFLTDPEETKRSFESILSNHPDPSSLLNYLNERRFILLLKILDHCDCLKKFLIKHPQDFERTIPRLWYVFKDKNDYLKEISQIAPPDLPEEKFSTTLAYYRHRELMRILSKEILKTAKLEDILREYSYLADALIEYAYQKALIEAKEKHGRPVNEKGEELTAVILGLGKLGSEELNYYSDVDLIFVHSDDKGSCGSLTANEFFSEVFRKTVSLLTAKTSEGQALNVDLELRPFGKTGPVTMSIRSAELYYESYGRIWERFALLRTRPVAGDMILGKRFLKEVVNPFVYSSADYKLVAEIKNMKRQIEAEARKRLGKGFNVKTGEGGIREIEFTVHAISILAGAKNKFLRERNTFRSIWKLCQRGIFSDEEALFLERAYEFLRTLEHRIQLRSCLQNHTFKTEEAEFYAKAMGFEDHEKFIEELERVREGVKKIFESLIPERKEEELDPIQVALITDDPDLGSHVLKEKGLSNPGKVFGLLRCYVTGKEGIKLSDKERERFIAIAPRLIELASKTHDPFETLKNFEKFFSNPTGKKVILSEPKEDFLGNLFNVFSISETLSSLISKNPDLVEDVLTLYQKYPERTRLEDEFKKYEQTLNLSFENLVRRFKRVWEIRIGLLYLMSIKNEENLTGLYDSLSALADFLIAKIWEKTELAGSDAIVLSLGKLGSKELTFRSDLDLVFCASGNGRHLITSRVKDFIRMITTHTTEGYLYEVDFRLRPMGSKGELVPLLDFYRDYFRGEARTWERLAWTRSRLIAGKQDLGEELEGLIREFLFGGEWGEKQRKEVLEMRFKLQEHSSPKRDAIDIKFGLGGTFDGEFLVQYLSIKEKIRESSMVKGFKKLLKKYPSLERAYRSFIFLRQVETHLRLLRESGGSVVKKQDFPALARSFGVEEDEFAEDLKRFRKILRETLLEFLD